MKILQGLLSFFLLLVFNGCANKINPTQNSVSNKISSPEKCSEKIVFFSSRTNNGDLYTYNPATLETGSFVIADSAVGSPVYDQLSNSLIFAQKKSNIRNLFSKNLDSGEIEFLLTNPAGDEVPDWSPNTRKIVFSSKISTQNYSLIIQDVETGKMLVIYEGAKQPYDPVWSPGGNQVAFVVTDTLFNADIAIINSDGSGFRNLTNNSKLNGHPDWSPDGKSLLFYIYQNGNADLYTLEIDSKSLTQLTFDSANQLIGRYSSSGKKITYGGVINDDWEVFVMDSDGNNKERISFNPGFDGDPVWIPCKI
ncbi:MAG: hypothetical protein ROO71_10845 [Balneola sp.]